MSTPALPPALAARAEAIADVCRSFGVRRLQAIGSAVEGPFERTRSDFDFLVELDDGDPGSRAERLLGLGEAAARLLKEDTALGERIPALRQTLSAPTLPDGPPGSS